MLLDEIEYEAQLSLKATGASVTQVKISWRSCEVKGSLFF